LLDGLADDQAVGEAPARHEMSTFSNSAPMNARLPSGSVFFTRIFAIPTRAPAMASPWWEFFAWLELGGLTRLGET